MDPAAASLFRQALERALELSPTHTFALGSLATSYLLEHRPAEALAIARRGPPSIHRLQAEAAAEYSLGHVDEARRLLEELVAKFSEDGALQIAELFAWRGETDKAFEWLLRARAQHDTGMGVLKSSILLRSLHKDPRWKALLVSLNLPVD